MHQRMGTQVMLVPARHTASRTKKTALVAELQAIRLLLINTLEPLLRGEKMSCRTVQGVAPVRENNKRKAAEEMLASYATGSREE